MEMRDYVIFWEPDCEPKIKFINRNTLLTETQDKLNEAKQIASRLIGCEYVDGINLNIDGQYYGGIYCDDLAVSRYPYRFTINDNRAHGPLVIINEVGGLAKYDCDVILKWLKKNVKE